MLQHHGSDDDKTTDGSILVDDTKVIMVKPKSSVSYSHISNF